MPLYEYVCTRKECPGGIEAVRPVAERFDAPTCHQCGAPMKLLVSPVRGIVRDPAVPRRPK